MGQLNISQSLNAHAQLSSIVLSEPSPTSNASDEGSEYENMAHTFLVRLHGFSDSSIYHVYVKRPYIIVRMPILQFDRLFFSSRKLSRCPSRQVSVHSNMTLVQ